MKKVITYGTYDLFHQGHYNLLKHAKELGDYLIVGVTSEAFDQSRGKLNVRDPLVKRIENVRKTGFADEIIVEEYMGQKIDDIKKYDIDIFTVGSDWVGHFDYLNEFCKVHYLERTRGVSSTDIRNKDTINVGIIGAENIVRRFCAEAKFVSGLEIAGIYAAEERRDFAAEMAAQNDISLYLNLEEMLAQVEAVYICTPMNEHYKYACRALEAGKHIICEFPFLNSVEEARILFKMAEEKNMVLLHGLKTAYCPAFQRLVSLAKTGLIGNIISIDARFTQILGDCIPLQVRIASGGSMNSVGEYSLLAAFKLLGTDFKEVRFYSGCKDGVDIFTRFCLRYDNAVVTATAAIGAKSEGSLTIAGTRGYLYVPSPWWKTEYFEARFEDFNKNMKYFYKFQGEGLRYELAEFVSCIVKHRQPLSLTKEDIIAMAGILEQYRKGVGVEMI